MSKLKDKLKASMRPEAPGTAVPGTETAKPEAVQRPAASNTAPASPVAATQPVLAKPVVSSRPSDKKSVPAMAASTRQNQGQARMQHCPVWPD